MGNNGLTPMSLTSKTPGDRPASFFQSSFTAAEAEKSAQAVNDS